MPIKPIFIEESIWEVCMNIDRSRSHVLEDDRFLKSRSTQRFRLAMSHKNRLTTRDNSTNKIMKESNSNLFEVLN